MSRNQQHITRTYPVLAEALDGCGRTTCVLDGETVAFSGARTSFQRLQGQMQVKDPDEARKSRITVFLHLFDVLHVHETSPRQLPLRTRKQILKRAVDFADPIRFTTHRNENGEKF